MKESAAGMVDWRTASREALRAVIARQQRELPGLQRTAAERRVTIGRLAARLRELHDLRVGQPTDEALGAWAAAVPAISAEAVACPHPDARLRVRAMRRFEERRLEACRPFLADRTAPRRMLCARIERHLAELFVFAAHPEGPPDNNAAERSLRHPVTGREISGGTRSPQGTATEMTTSPIFGTWRPQGLDPRRACRGLLAQPQI